ncbi:N-acetylmuramoyl-L-alanine amidase [Streptomyces sp. NPDC056069]|uniref:peptidoglycan recognition protein family protein n=1 Tax=Streptomyces sp. NPDC056069 TaxID=3345702 RepID=UPI0035E3583B
MAWYPGATKYELQPESDSQPAIKPTQFIMHSIIAPWTAKRVYEYWRDSTNLESHFGLGYEGDLGQFIGTETRADANYQANRRPDGTGAVSIETASNLQGSDPWTPAQVEKLIELGVWMHQHHGVPLRICRTHDDPGFGYHRLHAEWAVSGTTCPGDARVRQFKDVVFPGIVARANGQTTPPPEENDMPTPAEYAKAVWDHGISNRFRPGPGGKPRTIPARYFQEWSDSHFDDLMAAIAKAPAPALTPEQLAALADKVAAHPTLAERIAELVADKLAARLAD